MDLTNDDLKSYREKGFFFSSRIFSDAELDLVIEAQDRFYKNPPEWPFKKIARCGWNPGEENSLRKNDFVQMMVPEIRNLILKPELGNIAAFLTGERVRLWQDQLSYKAPLDQEQKTAMGWHNDHQYWSACSAQNMISAWIPFEDMEIEMGPIMYLEGSHQWQAIEGMDFFSTDLNQLEEKISRAGHSLKKVPVVLKRGQVSFHHARTLHGSGSNRSAKSRRALAVHMQPVSNRPVPGKFHLAKVLNSELGPVDYAHPLLFPLLGSGSGNV